MSLGCYGFASRMELPIPGMMTILSGLGSRESIHRQPTSRSSERAGAVHVSGQFESQLRLLPVAELDVGLPRYYHDQVAIQPLQSAATSGCLEGILDVLVCRFPLRLRWCFGFRA